MQRWGKARSPCSWEVLKISRPRKAPPTLLCVADAAGMSKSAVCSLSPELGSLSKAFLEESLLQGSKRLSWK
ncbi:hypothetical protein DBR06_SOUSAS4410062, partial [Sousa chinensis]